MSVTTHKTQAEEGEALTAPLCCRDTGSCTGSVPLDSIWLAPVASVPAHQGDFILFTRATEGTVIPAPPAYQLIYLSEFPNRLHPGVGRDPQPGKGLRSFYLAGKIHLLGVDLNTTHRRS